MRPPLPPSPTLEHRAHSVSIHSEWNMAWKAFCDVRPRPFALSPVHAVPVELTFSPLSFLQLVQDQEEERLEFVKSRMWDYANGLSAVAMQEDEVRRRILSLLAGRSLADSPLPSCSRPSVPGLLSSSAIPRSTSASSCRSSARATSSRTRSRSSTSRPRRRRPSRATSRRASSARRPGSQASSTRRRPSATSRARSGSSRRRLQDRAPRSRCR